MDLETYINSFSEATRDAVLSQIVKSRIVKQAIETQAGKALLNSVIDDIRDKTMSLMAVCTEKTKAEQFERILQTTTEIHIMYRLLKSWAQILKDGEKHEKMLGNT